MFPWRIVRTVGAWPVTHRVWFFSSYLLRGFFSFVYVRMIGVCPCEWMVERAVWFILFSWPQGSGYMAHGQIHDKKKIYPQVHDSGCWWSCFLNLINFLYFLYFEIRRFFSLHKHVLRLGIPRYFYFYFSKKFLDLFYFNYFSWYSEYSNFGLDFGWWSLFLFFGGYIWGGGEKREKNKKEAKVSLFFFFLFGFKSTSFCQFFSQFFFFQNVEYFPKNELELFGKKPNAFGFGWIGSDNISQSLYAS